MKLKKIINITFLSIFAVSNLTYNVNALEIRQSDLLPEIQEEYFGDMTSERREFALEVYKDKAYIFGGESHSGYTDKLEILDLNTKKWTTGATMPVKYDMARPATCVYKNKIYLLGSESPNMYVYDIEADAWSIEAQAPISGMGIMYAKMEVYNNNIYILGGFQSINYKYNLETKTFTKLTDVPKMYTELSTVFLDNKIYCFGDYGAGDDYNYIYNIDTDTWSATSETPKYLTGASAIRKDEKIYLLEQTENSSNLLEYDTKTDTWNSKEFTASIKILSRGGSFIREGKIYKFGGAISYDQSSNKIYTYKISDTKSKEEIAEDILEEVENGNFENAINPKLGDLINELPDSSLKEELQDRFDNVKDTIPDALPGLTPETVTANLDVYIKSENMLSLSLNTNSVTFENYSGVEDMEKLNAINLTVSSSLPYKVDVYLANEMQNADKSETLDISVLNIKENSESVYKQFVNTTDAINLLDNQLAGNDNIHSVDLKLASSLAHKADIYKTTLKFEVEQK